MDAMTPSDVLTLPTVELADRWPTTSVATWLGRKSPVTSEGEAIRQVAVWLRIWSAGGDPFADTNEGQLQRIAYALIAQRGAIEAKAKEAYERDTAQVEVTDAGVRDWRPPTPCGSSCALPTRPSSNRRRLPLNVETRVRLSVGWVTSAMARLPWISTFYIRTAKK